MSSSEYREAKHLCRDPTSEAVGEFEEGQPLFDGDQPTESTKAILQFCEQFEAAGQRTAAFIEELKASDLLMDGEVADPEGFAQAEYAATGFMLISRRVLEKMAAGHPELKYTHGFTADQTATTEDVSNLYALFDTSLDRDRGLYLPEDYTFCNRWRARDHDAAQPRCSRPSPPLTNRNHGHVPHSLLRLLF